MPIYIGGGRKVLFVHVPKTGGTSIERAFVRSGYRQHIRDAKTNKGTIHRLRRCSPQHFHAAMLEQMFRLDRFDVICMLVRDPLARFRSEVSMWHRGSKPPGVLKVDSWARRSFQKYADDPYVHDNHLRPQSEFEVAGAVVYRTEDGLSMMVKDLNERFDLGLDTEIPHIMRSSKAFGYDSSDVPVSPWTDRRVRRFYAADYERYGY